MRPPRPPATPASIFISKLRPVSSRIISPQVFTQIPMRAFHSRDCMRPPKNNHFYVFSATVFLHFLISKQNPERPGGRALGGVRITDGDYITVVTHGMFRPFSLFPVSTLCIGHLRCSTAGLYAVRNDLHTASAVQESSWRCYVYTALSHKCEMCCGILHQAEHIHPP